MRGIRARLLLLIALVSAPVFAFTLYQGLEERRRAAAREREDARRLVQLFAEEHRRVVADARQILFVLAQVPSVRRAEPSACTEVFRDVLAASPAYENLLLVDREGVVAVGRPDAIDEADRALVARAQESTFAVGPIRLPASASFPTLDVAHAVPAEDRAPPRALLARLEMRWVAGEIAVAGVGNLVRVTLWDPSGRILLRHPDPEGFLGRDASGSEVWQAIRANGGEGTAEAAGGDGVRRLYGFTRLTGESDHRALTLSLGVPTEVAFADLRRLERRNLLTLAFLTALAAAMAWAGAERLAQLFGRMQRMAERDALTGLSNRRHLRAAAEEEQRRARRFGHPLALLMLDLDHFKQVNDRHGHATGDDVLREVARRIKATVREIDLPARYGGEEFAVLLPETGLDTAREAAERIRAAVGDAPIPTRRGPLAVTLSAGVAVLGDQGDLGTLLEAADAALYAAKAAGRNRVAVAPVSQR